MDYYSVLGIPRNATSDEIKKAYRKLAMRFHPDRTGGDDTKFKQINEAYDVLKDPAKKQEYDNPQPRFDTNSMNQGNPFGAGFEDMFSQMFNQQMRRPRRPMNRDISIDTHISLRDVYSGKSVVVSYQAGARQEVVTIDIPRGAKDGDQIRYEGLGDDADRRFPRGALLVRIKISKDPDFDRDGNDLFTIKYVSTIDLILGTNLIITTPNGKSVKLNIPKGSNPGVTFSINGYGLPDLHSSKVGNLYVKVQGVTPKITDQETLNKLTEVRNATNI